MNLITEILNEFDAPPPAIHQHQSIHKFAPEFINFIKIAENASKTGYNAVKKLWFPVKSPEGGFPTIGFGHKIQSISELKKFSKGVSDAEMEKILIQDLYKAKELVYDYIKKKYKVNLLLDKNQEEMLIEFAFNLGSLDKFPKFVDSVLRKKWDIVKKEYKRGYKTPNGKRVELTRRNNLFYKQFLSNV